MKHTSVILWLMILTAVAGGYTALTVYRAMQAETEPAKSQYMTVDYAELAKERKLKPTEFLLTDSDGNLFSSQFLRGKVWVLSFFYSTCGRECFELNQALTKVQRDIPDPNLYFVSITCNPEIDTPEMLKQYKTTKGFQADALRWILLTGDYEYIGKQIALPALLAYGRSLHSREIVLVGKDGVIREKYKLLADGEMDKVEAKLRELLAEPDPDPTAIASPAGPRTVPPTPPNKDEE
ncbi:MAG: SCO family protein [Pirellulales bacterium]